MAALYQYLLDFRNIVSQLVTLFIVHQILTNAPKGLPVSVMAALVRIHGVDTTASAGGTFYTYQIKIPALVRTNILAVKF